MIPVLEAKRIIENQTDRAKLVSLPLLEAQALVLAEDVFAPNDIPAYPQSSMDGYALSFESWRFGHPLSIIGEVAAGHNKEESLAQGHAVRIFTGAAVPPGADTVVMQEKVKTDNRHLFIEDEALQPYANVRPQGSEIKAGALALEAGSLLTPAAIGFLAGMGFTHVKVYPAPKISLIVTGNELQAPGQPLHYGQVYESNSFLLTAVLRQMQISRLAIYNAEDDLQTLSDTLAMALDQSDMVLLTGGVSVGDYDFTLDAAANCGVEKIFHKIKQKPGKPFFFGKKDQKLVFGLPGNPGSVLTCFYEYVAIALERWMGREPGIISLMAPLALPYQKPAGLKHFLKGYYDGQRAFPLDAQESYRLRSFAKANCLIVIEEEQTECPEGQLVEIHLLPR